MHELSFPCYCWTERWFFKTVRCSSNERNTNQHLRQILDDGVCIFNNGALDFFFFGSFALAIFVAIDCTVKQNKTNTKLCYFLFNSFNAYLRIFQLNWNFVYPPFFICVLKFFSFEHSALRFAYKMMTRIVLRKSKQSIQSNVCKHLDIYEYRKNIR